MEKKVDKLHLIYSFVIFLLIITSVVICWVLSSKNVISDHVFENFSFAATISSILLAVVSIVYTIYSGAETSSSIGVLKNVENNITKQIDTLRDVESVIKESIGEGNMKMEETIKAQINQLISPSKDFEIAERYGDISFDIDIYNNPPLGNVFLYCCFLSNKNNKPFSLNLLGESIGFYFNGYMSALKSVPAIKFTYQLDKNNKTISHCKFAGGIMDTITIENLNKRLEEQSKEYPTLVKIKLNIDTYFSVNE